MIQKLYQYSPYIFLFQENVVVKKTINIFEKVKGYEWAILKFLCLSSKIKLKDCEFFKTPGKYN